MTKKITGKYARTTTLRDQVIRAEGAKEFSKPDDAYEFSNGKRIFKDPGRYGGPYTGTGT